MAKIAYLNIPGHGHVNPTLPVVQELVRRGNEVIYYNTGEFRVRIERTGAQMCAYPASMPTSAEVADLLSAGNMVKVTRMLFQASEPLVPYLLEELSRQQPDLIVHDSVALWGFVCARILNIPTVSSITHFIFDGVEMHRTPQEILRILWHALPLMLDILRSRGRLIRKYGRDVFQTGHLLPVLGDLNVMFTAEFLQPRSTLIDHRFRFVGPSINPQTRENDDFPHDQLSPKPLIYISLGRVHHSPTAFYRTAVDAFASYPGQFVMSVDSQTTADSLARAPSNFIIRSRVPQLDILQQADLFVTHGGMNSIHEGLYYGVPLVIIPRQMEQLFNARVVVSNGAGVLLGNGFPGQVSVEKLRAAVDEVLTAPPYRERARSIGQLLANTGGFRHAADEIEKLALCGRDSNAGLTQAPLTPEFGQA